MDYEASPQSLWFFLLIISSVHSVLRGHGAVEIDVLLAMSDFVLHLSAVIIMIAADAWIHVHPDIAHELCGKRFDVRCKQYLLARFDLVR